MQRPTHLVLRVGAATRTSSWPDTIVWATALVGTVVAAAAGVEVFWLLAALVAGLSLSGSV